MSLTDNESGLALIYENSENFAFRLIYNGGADEYICLEPQNCAANAPNAPFGREIGGFEFIKSKETKIFTSKIYVKEIKK
jgi:galactose mutarotase-like enzyme